MRNLSIGITAPIIFLRTKREFELTEGERLIIKAVEQQNIVLSDLIIDYYKNSLKCPEIVDLFITAIGNQNKAKYITTKRQHHDGIEQLLYFVEQQDLKILIGEKNDIRPYKSKNVNLVQPSKIAAGKETAISNYVFPVNIHICEGYSNEKIAKWFFHLFKDEKKIDIQDKFIFKEEGLYSLKNYYLPNISEKTEINIYGMQTYNTSDEDIESFIHEKMFDDYNINIYLCSQMKHDRYIELNDLRINIGAGLDIFGSSGTVSYSKECDIDVIRINDSSRLTKPRISKQLR